MVTRPACNARDKTRQAASRHWGRELAWDPVFGALDLNES